MKLFKKQTAVPSSYRPVLEATEVLELFARMTLETFQVLQNICDERGWTKIEALKRLITKEQKLIKNENQRSRP